LECVGYVAMYFLRGSLPWQNLKATNKKDKYEKIMEKKLSTPVEVTEIIKLFILFLDFVQRVSSRVFHLFDLHEKSQVR
jgi:hypothetical protein